MFDWSVVEDVLKLNGRLLKDLSQHLGIDEETLLRWRRRPELLTYAGAVKVAVFLGVPLGTLDREVAVTQRWMPFHKSDGARLKRFHEQFKNAVSVLTVSQSIDSYLQPDDWMLDFSNRDWMNIEEWDAHKLILLPYVAQQRESREHSDFHHRLIAPFAICEYAAHERPEWLDTVRKGLYYYKSETAVCFVKKWNHFERELTATLPKSVTQWDKVCIVDDQSALIHLDSHYYYHCEYEPEVRDLRGRIQHVIRKQLPEFPADPFCTAQGVREVNKDARATVDFLLELNPSERPSRPRRPR